MAFSLCQDLIIATPSISETRTQRLARFLEKLLHLLTILAPLCLVFNPEKEDM